MSNSSCQLIEWNVMPKEIQLGAMIGMFIGAFLFAYDEKQSYRGSGHHLELFGASFCGAIAGYVVGGIAIVCWPLSLCALLATGTMIVMDYFHTKSN